MIDNPYDSLLKYLAMIIGIKVFSIKVALKSIETMLPDRNLHSPPNIFIGQGSSICF